MRKLITAFLFTLMVQPATAGSPINVDLACPIWDETAPAIESPSCSSTGRGTLSLRSITSCDFITRLPVCPKSGIPLYWGFDGIDPATLEEIVASDAWKALEGKSRYLRAHLLEMRLELLNPVQRFLLMYGGYQYDLDKSWGDEQYLSVLLPIADAAIAASNDDMPIFINLMTALALIHAHRPDDAKARIEAARAHPQFAGYPAPGVVADAMTACLHTPEAETCHPEYEVQMQ
ncbi:hypothetical protein RXV86_03955 [Alisedimentitalea sp. MJ-SS2]|uniref:hypothetical protein n=1 Tax=Aliisedimentitalea sp. MJ-SS2 TaxID=3049795 RepID=UPI002914833A|nr:hypothetical protein [Alisedimentitalea sp. MJ-SS2]MDU8926532.1 hypothetical protein [Alisedimentitalea sp. MJ-SS2]